MGLFHTSTALVYTVLLLISSTLVAGIQYCHTGPDFCFAATTQQNTSSDSHDVYLTISATPSKKGGWTGVGLGREMKGALMFIVYEDQESKSLITSIRSASGHVMPSVVKDAHEQVSVLHATVSDDKYLAQFVCYSCWSPEVEVNGLSPYIFAGNKEQAFYGADKYSSLTQHEFNGKIWGNMSVTAKDSTNSAPSIQGEETIGITEDSPVPEPKKHKGLFTPVRIHGAIMTVSFMGLYFVGSMAIRSPLIRAFKYHWMIQAGASVLALGNGLYMLLRSTHFHLHKIIGLAILCSLIIQAAAGYKHHIDFVKIRRQTIFTLVHRWLGRGILLFGTMNVGLGMYRRHWSSLGLFIWFLIWCVEIAGYGYVLWQHQRRQSQQRGHAIPKEDLEDIADAEVFDLGDDFDEEEDEVEGYPLMDRQKNT
ncbi:hypothetical protein TMatcc_000752 [Talaromyces marneffei ATCC 18224]|uniref:Cytochrome b561 domain-containing protein n=2 Tax=Talaromyces marneffei TaxID=37727 RepID=B6QRB7_TALMQ|nr:uncharacterized protein EYB26_003312 [Talaromyces marneffei]EEA20763.1 conserved hypothetical protein [Talaromyces marneffei ATCC 18224]KAE8549726.1 hypothetical protein EYB25_008250 [Talaromyces marneffei]QGA15652.1 hypothetical protein EYB26_003312 [Talaromyces marneffei]